jgi:hypothetical protein
MKLRGSTVANSQDNKYLERIADSTERLSAQMSDLHRTVEMLFYMTEKHQAKVRDMLEQIANQR